MEAQSITLRLLLEHPLDVPVFQWVLFFIVMALAFTVLLLQLKDDPLDLRYLIMDSAKKPSIPKIGQIIALVVSTYAFVIMLFKGQLSDTFFFGYMAIWSGSATVEAYLSKKSEKPKRKPFNKGE